MKFDKSRVYTAVNADDLREIRRLVSIEDTSQVLIAIKGESYKYLNLIKNNAIYCATKMIRVAALAQKAIDSNAVKG